ncbi:MAG: ABC transporter ATP-binding protein [Candidatus Bipolaricaulia bacterium]
MTLLDLQGVTKDYPLGSTVVNALRGLDLSIEKGEIVAIMGPSGSGKSTLMHILGALDTPTGGKARLEGQDLRGMDEDALVTLRGKKVGFVFQTFNLIQSLTAQQNVELPMTFLGVKKAARAERAQALLEKVGLADRVTHRPNELSGGERQRVAIARALANNPEILLADEPTGNLDSETGRTILDLLKKLCEDEGKTMILITHDPDAAAIAGRIVRLRDGRILEEVKRV